MTSCSTKERHLLTIGYNVGASMAGRELLRFTCFGSEAGRSFVAIAQGQLPQENWFTLGRLLTTAGGEPILLSWGGSMFEYLMPLLVMPERMKTLCSTRPIRRLWPGRSVWKSAEVPWGISESGYNTIDVRLNYRYRAFGVPGLGLRARARRGSQ